MQQYSLRTPTVAVSASEGTKKIVTLPTNAVVEVALAIDHEAGLVEVSVEGETLTMFAEDLRRHGRLMAQAAVPR